jgi:hypothetical protein
VTGLEIRPLWRAAALAALVAFLWLPRGHLAGHDEVSAARAHHGAGALSVAAAPPHVEGSERAPSCTLCLSLAKVRSSIAALASAGWSAPTLASPVAAHRSLYVPETFVSAHTAPRAPPAS